MLVYKARVEFFGVSPFNPPNFLPMPRNPVPSPGRPHRPARQQKRWRRLWRYIYLRVIRVRGSSGNIARGLGVGVFAGMLPMFGLQMVTALVLAAWFRGNKFLAVLGTWVSNPLTDIPIHLFNFRVGQWILRSDQTFVAINDWQDLVNQGARVVVIWMTGGITMGLIMGGS
jgi:uncharacterized protein